MPPGRHRGTNRPSSLNLSSLPGCGRPPGTMSHVLPPSRPGGPARASFTRRLTSREYRSNSMCSSTATRSPKPVVLRSSASSCSEPRHQRVAVFRRWAARRRPSRGRRDGGCTARLGRGFARTPSEHGSVRPTVTDLARQFDGNVLITSKMWGVPTGPNPSGHRRRSSPGLRRPRAWESWSPTATNSPVGASLDGAATCPDAGADPQGSSGSHRSGDRGGSAEDRTWTAHVATG